MYWAQSSIPRLELCTTLLRGRHSSNSIQRRLARYLTTTYTLESFCPRLKRMTMSSILSVSCPLVDGYTSLTDLRLELFIIESYSYYMLILLINPKFRLGQLIMDLRDKIGLMQSGRIMPKHKLESLLFCVNFIVSSFQTYHWSSNGQVHSGWNPLQSYGFDTGQDRKVGSSIVGTY